MFNLVLWRWGPTLPHKVDVHDPDKRLPKDQSSWPT
jgi:RES domain-containing protein